MEIFKWLDDSSLVASYSINDFRKSGSASYLNLQVTFVDNSELHSREYVDADHRKYAFHWQTVSGELLSRWDNAPHFADFTTFPHHRHLASGEVAESHDISFNEVMEIIQSQMQTL